LPDRAQTRLARNNSAKRYNWMPLQAGMAGGDGSYTAQPERSIIPYAHKSRLLSILCRQIKRKMAKKSHEATANGGQA